MPARIRLLVVTLFLLPSAIANAQAWVNAKGELSLGLDVDYQFSSGVYHGSTLVTDTGATSIRNGLSAEYIPIDQLAVGLALTLSGDRYDGLQSVPGFPFALNHGENDDGSLHWAMTDLDVEGRYQVYDGAVALTPVLRFRTPITDYENKGYAASGSGLRELSAGIYLGRYGLGLEDLVLQLSYTFTYVQKEKGGGSATSQYRVNRSDIDLALAYVISEKLIVGAGAAFRETHDGFDLEEYPMLAASDPLIMWHDPVLKRRYLAPTVIGSYQFNRAWSLSARFAMVVMGRSVSNAISFGLSLGWSNNFADVD